MQMGLLLPGGTGCPTLEVHHLRRRQRPICGNGEKADVTTRIVGGHGQSSLTVHPHETGIAAPRGLCVELGEPLLLLIESVCH